MLTTEDRKVTKDRIKKNDDNPFRDGALRRIFRRCRRARMWNTQAMALVVVAGCALNASPHPASGTSHPTKVLVFVEENHSYSQAKSGMPYLWSLAQRYGYDGNYHAVGNPSLPNYLAIAGGSTFGVTDDKAPAAHPINATTVFDQALSAGYSAKAYNESMPSNCRMSNASPYAVRHNPWTYFTPSRTNCNAFDISTSTLLSNAQDNALPNVGMVTPNLNDDAHKGTLAQADNWLKAQMPTLLGSSDFTSGQLAVVIVFDGSSGNHESAPTLAVVCDVNLSGTVVSTSLNHYGLSRWLSETVGAAPLKNAATAVDMGSEFGL